MIVCRYVGESAEKIRESQANTAQHHTDGQNLIHHQERGYTILVFARGQKKRNNVTVRLPFWGRWT